MRTETTRRSFLSAGIASLLGGCARALGERDGGEVDRLGTFEHVPGRAGVVVAAPHGSSDAGSLVTARIIRDWTGAGGVFVTGFWNRDRRERINVNRDSEQVFDANWVVARQWQSARAAYVNARYVSLVSLVAQGPLHLFFEVHSNGLPRFARSVEVSTLGVSRDEAKRFRDAFLSARDRRLSNRDAPRLEVNVAPHKDVWFSYRQSSSISELSAKGFLIESPAAVTIHAAWRDVYAEILAEAVARSLLAAGGTASRASVVAS